MTDTDFQAIWIPEAREKIAKQLAWAKRSRDATKPDGWYRKQHEPVIAALEAALAAFDESVSRTDSDERSASTEGERNDG